MTENGEDNISTQQVDNTRTALLEGSAGKTHAKNNADFFFDVQ